VEEEEKKEEETGKEGENCRSHCHRRNAAATQTAVSAASRLLGL